MHSRHHAFPLTDLITDMTAEEAEVVIHGDPAGVEVAAAEILETVPAGETVERIDAAVPAGTGALVPRDEEVIDRTARPVRSVTEIEAVTE